MIVDNMKIISENKSKIVVEFSGGEIKPDVLKSADNRTLIHGNCPECGVDLYHLTYKKNIQYCSNKCRLKNHRFETTCASCGKPLIKPKARMRESGIYYCNKCCQDKHAGILKRNAKLYCSVCGKRMYGKGVIKTGICFMCAKQKKLKQFISGEFYNTVIKLGAGIYREYMFDRADNKCSKCGWTAVHPVTGKIPLHIHHKDGNYKNNILSNLVVLCPNCHVLTESYGSLNKGNGRKDRYT